MLAASENHPPGLPPVGTLVGGKYRLERYIAEGGMGVIAVAQHVELDEPVALKFLKPDVVASDPTGELARRFVREARATIKIRSEHVPRIFDVTTLDIGVPYIVMELLVGQDLDAWLEREGPLPVVFVVDLILQSLEALAAAHALGMVHRDFKPANLFVSKRLDGSACVKVLDFGIAKLVDRTGAGRDSGLTGTNAVMGSPRYMSPEQMRSTRDVDGRTDIWAVGTTLYELLTGRPPFDGESLTQVCAAILQDEPDTMVGRRPDLPRELEAVVRRCLAKRPADRPADVAELATALAPFGTAPASRELASRVARVLGTAVGAAAPAPSGNLSAAAPQSSEPRLPTQVPVASGAATVAVTSTSWGGKDTASHAGRRRVWTIATVFALLFVTGSVLGGVALLRARRHVGPTVGAALGPPSAAGSTVAAAEPSAPPPADLQGEPPPRLAASTATAATAAPPTEPARSRTTAEPRAPTTGAKAVTAPPPVTATATKPTATPGAAKPTTTPGATKPASTPPAGGLWDDRK